MSHSLAVLSRVPDENSDHKNESQLGLENIEVKGYKYHGKQRILYRVLIVGFEMLQASWQNDLQYDIIFIVPGSLIKRIPVRLTVSRIHLPIRYSNW